MCGIFGIIGTPEAARLTSRGLLHLRHRGQEGVGVASWDGGPDFLTYRESAYAGDVFNDAILRALPGRAAIGQVLYSTYESGEEEKRDRVIQDRVQPFTNHFELGPLAITHNGNLTNARKLARELLAQGRSLQTGGVDTEVALQLIGTAPGESMIARLKHALPQLEGAYSFVLLSPKKLIGVRDPLGIRPLFIGRIGEAFAFASEDCALYALGARGVCEVKPGEIIVVENGRVTLHTFAMHPTKPRPCIFEYVYFARPDSTLEGQSVSEVREQCGMELAHEAPVKAGMVVPIPDSGVPAALGYACALNLPLKFAIIRNHYPFRTFIDETERERDRKVALKFSINRSVVRGESIVLVDDSIVRGRTSAWLVEQLFNAGAREVHLRSASPPWRHNCHWGIDEKDPANRIASVSMSDEEVCARVKEVTKATSVAYLSVKGLYNAVYGCTRGAVPRACDHCFTGERPTPITDLVSLH